MALLRTAPTPRRGARALPRATALLVALAMACACPVAAADEAPPTEYEVKAAFLYNFLSFVEWPADPDDTGPFTVAVVGRDPFGESLDHVVAGEARAGRLLQVRRVERVREAAGAHVVFLGVPDSQVGGALRELEGRPVLTVGETRDFVRDGGMIQFRVVDGRVRFDVNAAAADAARLKVSSHLLKLALQVVPPPADREGRTRPDR